MEAAPATPAPTMPIAASEPAFSIADLSVCAHQQARYQYLLRLPENGNRRTFFNLLTPIP